MGLNTSQKGPADEDRLLGGIIGMMRLNREAGTPVLGALQPQHFGRESNRAVFAAVLALHNSGRAIDLVTVYEHLTTTRQVGDGISAFDLAVLWEAQCEPEEVPGLADLLARGSGRAPPRPPQPAPPRDPMPDILAGDEGVDTSFEFGANVMPGGDS